MCFPVNRKDANFPSFNLLSMCSVSLNDRSNASWVNIGICVLFPKVFLNYFQNFSHKISQDCKLMCDTFQIIPMQLQLKIKIFFLFLFLFSVTKLILPGSKLEARTGTDEYPHIRVY